MVLFEERKTDVRTGRDMSLFGAFSGADVVDFALHIRPEAIPAGHQIHTVEMILHADGWNEGKTEYHSLRLQPENTAEDKFVYHVRLNGEKLLGNLHLPGEGLLYYHYAVTCGESEDMQPDAVYYLGGEAPTALEQLENFVGERQLLLYQAGYHTSDSFRNGVLYHIFVDRFATSGKYPVKERAIFDPDWENGIPQYGEYPGADVDNNVFFGGDLTGIEEKLPYIASLGVTTLYLSPVFSAYSNHKYDTADYLTVDSMFGGEEALTSLCKAAKKEGISVILDGVFNHTGSDSVYFNREGTYNSIGAYQSKESPYYDWYSFRDYPDDYECWWNVKTLPRLRSDREEVRRFFCEKVVPKWMQAGISGWRLDVADELAENFLDDFRKAVKKENPDGIIIGEVWEDASDKVSYGRRRRYLGGQQLDSVMNYPLRSALIEYVQTGNTGPLRRYTEGTYRRYPKASSDTLMNFMGTHDTERILTVLGGADDSAWTNDERSTARMTETERKQAVQKLLFAYAILAGLPGVPCVFYGDEAGMEGYRDPFCRRPFPWTNIDREVLAQVQRLGKIRQTEPVFRDGTFRILYLSPEGFVYVREPYEEKAERVLVAGCRAGTLKLRLPGNAAALFGKTKRDVVLHEGEAGYYRCPGDSCLTAERLTIRTVSDTTK